MLLAGAVFADTPLKPLPPRAPEALAPNGLRVHVRAHEDLDVDRLRSFARPRVTLWLETRSNVLKASTIENLSRFDAVFVRLRAPVTESQVKAFDWAPRAGVWLDATQLEGHGIARVLGPRSLSVQVKGPIDEALFERVGRAKPEEIEWLAGADADVVSWGFFRQWPGKKLLSIDPPRACEASDAKTGPAARVHLASLLALGAAAFPCGPAPRVIVSADTDRWLIQSMVVRDPTAELELEVGNDDAAAKKATALLDELGFAAHR